MHHRRIRSLAVAVATLVVLGTVAAEAISTPGGTAGQRAARLKADRLARGNNVVVKDGKLSYSGEHAANAPLSTRLSEAVRQSQSPAAALKKSFVDSLVQAGLSGEFANEMATADPNSSRVGPYLAPGGDFDGDGKADVLAQEARLTWDGPMLLQVAATKGSDGSILWSRSFGGEDVGAFPATVNGKAGVIVASFSIHQGVGGGAVVAGAERFTGVIDITAVDASGATAWTKSFSGTLVVTEAFAVYAYEITIKADSFPSLAGLLNADGGADTDVLMRDEDLLVVCATGACTVDAAVDAVVLKGEQDGAEVLRATQDSDDSEPWPVTAPDFTNAGHDNILFVDAHGSDADLFAYNGENGEALWSTYVYGDFYSPVIVPVGNVTGTGGNDFVLSDEYAYYYGDGFETPLVQGIDGRVAWTRPATFPVRLAGAGPDGRDAVGTQTVDIENDSVAVRYDAFDGSGETLHSATYAVAGSSWNGIVSIFPSLGDLDNDGVADQGHRLSTVDWQAELFRKESGAVSGRTGLKLWSGIPGAPLPRDADGQDLATALVQSDSVIVTRQRGADASARWSQSLPGHYDLALLSGADVDGDGAADALVSPLAFDYDTYDRVGQPSVLDGRTGRVVWTIGNLPADGVSRTETKPYLAYPAGNTGPLPGGLAGDCRDSSLSLGGQCFQLNRNERTASFVITDASGLPAPGAYSFADDSLPFSVDYGDTQFFCGQSGPVAVPPGAVEVYVYAENGDTDCVGASTTGTVTATFQ